MRWLLLLAALPLSLSAQYRLYTCASISKGYVVGAPLPPSGLFGMASTGAFEHLGFNHPFLAALMRRKLRYTSDLRRISAFLLLLLFSLSLLSPLLASDSDANLPACCRKGGQHHCSMDAAVEHTGSGSGIRSNSRCPMYPGFAPGAISDFAGIPVSHSWAVQWTSARAACDSFELLLLRSVADRAHSKRGPPCSFSV
jgi:hypothetical protein